MRGIEADTDPNVPSRESSVAVGWLTVLAAMAGSALDRFDLDV